MSEIPLPIDNMPANIVFLAGIVIALTQMLKKVFKVKDTWATVIAIFFGMVTALLSQLSIDYPKLAPYYEKALWGLVIGLVAAGGYSIGKAVKRELSP